MRRFIGAVILVTALSGCATSKIDTHSATVDHTVITPGKIEYTFTDKTTQTETFPQEAPLTLKDGHFSHPQAGFSREAEIGWDIFGITIRPMVQIRVFYIMDFGGTIGADQNAFIAGLDWRYKDVIIGPLIGVPWYNPSQNIYGGKIAIPFNF